MTSATEPIPAAGRRTMSVSEAAAILGISRSTAYECIRTGEIPALHFGRRVVVTVKAVEELLASASVVAATAAPDADPDPDPE